MAPEGQHRLQKASIGSRRPAYHQEPAIKRTLAGSTEQDGSHRSKKDGEKDLIQNPAQSPEKNHLVQAELKRQRTTIMRPLKAMPVVLT
jgi:hypothetical protein